MGNLCIFCGVLCIQFRVSLVIGDDLPRVKIYMRNPFLHLQIRFHVVSSLLGVVATAQFSWNLPGSHFKLGVSCQDICFRCLLCRSGCGGTGTGAAGAGGWCW